MDYSRGEVEEWLRHLPGYRELIRQRVSDAQRRRRVKDGKLLRSELGRAATILGEINADKRTRFREDFDDLGPELEGCG